MIPDIQRPTMYLLVGPNGAGKTTLYNSVVSPIIKAPFINADLIQKDELQDPSMNAAYRAASIAMERRRECLNRNCSFVSETTFSHPSKLTLIEEARTAGFRIWIFHINVGSDDLSVARVATRVERGGHNVPEDKIRARYIRNQKLIKRAVLHAHKAFVYDNSQLGRRPRLVVSFGMGKVERVAPQVPDWVESLYSRELKIFRQSD